MRRTYIQFLFILVGCFIPNFVIAQVNDFGGITSFSVSKKIGRNAGAKIEQELRFNNHISTYDRSKTSVGVDYSLFRKKLNVELDYDFINQRNNEYFELKHRVSFGLSTDYAFNKLEFDFRTRGQSTWRDNQRGDYKYNPKYVWRNKLGIAYDLFGSPLKPFASGELFCPLNGSEGFYLDGYRLTTGLKYRVTKRTVLQFELRYDQELQQSNSQNILYAGVGWNYKL